MRTDTRKKALEWWRAMPEQRQSQLHQEWQKTTNDRRGLWMFGMFRLSSSAIECMYREIVLRENIIT